MGRWPDAAGKECAGVRTVYWVWFDEPQFDADGDGPYSGGGIWESALNLLTEESKPSGGR